jgi:hypothetical protein
MKKIIVLVIFVATCLSSGILLGQNSDMSGNMGPHSHPYVMHLGEGGEPNFSSSTSANGLMSVKDYWDSLFYRNSGYDSLIDKGLVTSIVTDGDNLYVAGCFEYFDGIRCFNVIRYNRLTGIWSTLDSGFSSTVNILKIHNGKLYAGGRFNSVGFYGTTPLQGIAMWDDIRKKWQQVGGGVDNSVTSIEFMDTSIVIGGFFQYADTTTPVSYIARWDGHTWDDMNGGVTNVVWALLATGDSLYVGGQFYTRATLQPSGIALYSGGNWLNLGDGLDGNVYALAMIKGKLWVGGNFFSTAHDQQQLYCLATWDGNNWNAFGSGIDTGLKGAEVFSITPVGDSLYIGGSFSAAAGVHAHGIVKWSKGIFTPISSGVYGEVHAIGAFNGSVYVGGTFLTAGNLTVNNIAKISTGDIWESIEATTGAIGAPIETYVDAIAATSQYVFIGGGFSTIAKKPFNHIAAWDKINRIWIPLGKGLDRDVWSLAIHDSNIYVGGSFNYAGDSLALHIAYWNMNTRIWHPMGGGGVRYISALAVNETGVYASVFFPFVVNTGFYNYMGRWDGYQWNQINGAISGYINAVAINGPTLTIGGTISSIDHIKYSNIAQNDGAGNWYPLATGVNNEVRSIAIADTDIYAAGYFTNAGTLPVNYIARWDGSYWNDLKVGLNSYAYALVWNGSSLYVGGNFTKTLSGTTADFLARWDGNTWNSVSNGTGADVLALAVDNSGLYCGGDFNHVNGLNLSSPRFGILHFASAGVDRTITENSALQNYPNPFSTETTISYSISRDGLVKIEIFDPLGLKVKTVVNAFKAAGDYEVTADMRDLPSGTYLCRFSEGGVIQSKVISLIK